MNQLTTLLSSMFSLVIVIPSLVQSVDPNMILMSILEIRNNYELLAYSHVTVVMSARFTCISNIKRTDNNND